MCACQHGRCSSTAGTLRERRISPCQVVHQASNTYISTRESAVTSALGLKSLSFPQGLSSSVSTGDLMIGRHIFHVTVASRDLSAVPVRRVTGYLVRGNSSSVCRGLPATTFIDKYTHPSPPYVRFDASSVCILFYI